MNAVTSPAAALFAGAACLWLAGIAIWVAALMPQFFPVWTGRPDALDVIAQHAALWRVNALLFLASAVLTLAGCAFIFTGARGTFGLPAVIVLAVATALWAVNLAVRLSIVPAVASNRSPQAESWLSLMQSFTGAAWYIASVLIAFAIAGLGVDVLSTATLPPWIGWLLLASAAFTVGLLIVMRDVPPIVAYVAVIPLAIAVTIKAVQAGR